MCNTCKSSNKNMMDAFCMMRAAVLMVSPKSRNLGHLRQKPSQAFTWLQNIASNPLPRRFPIAVSTALAASVQSLLQPQKANGQMISNHGFHENQEWYVWLRMTPYDTSQHVAGRCGTSWAHVTQTLSLGPLDQCECPSWASPAKMPSVSELNQVGNLWPPMGALDAMFYDVYSLPYHKRHMVTLWLLNMITKCYQLTLFCIHILYFFLLLRTSTPRPSLFGLAGFLSLPEMKLIVLVTLGALATERSKHARAHRHSEPRPATRP